jgi:uncharacterized membrane protein YoaK (UPF0700 family)
MLRPPVEAIRVQGRLAAVLALICGYIDAYTLLNYKVYASFMSGNTTQTGLGAGQGKLADAGHHFLPIPFFVIGIFLGTYLLNTRLRWLWGLVAALLAGGLGAAFLDPVPGWVSIGLFSMAMGIMNLTITQVGGQKVSLGFVTGDLNNLSRHLAQAVKGDPLSDSRGPWDTHWWRAGVLASVWGSFLLGGLLSGIGMTYFGAWVLLPPTLILLTLAVFEREVRVTGKAVAASHGGLAAGAAQTSPS